MSRSHKLLLYGCVFATTLLASPASSNEAEGTPHCTEGEELDEQEEPSCCETKMMKETEEGKLCTTPPSITSIATAITLILSFTFLISLQCFLHHHHMDMREYAYHLISLTISIFIAVLFFQSIRGVIDWLSYDLKKYLGAGRKTYLIVYGTLTVFFFIATQIVIAKVYRLSQKERDDAARANNDHQTTLQVRQEVQIGGICYGMLFAHLTGFAAVQFWAEVQEIPPFEQSALWTVPLLPAAVVVQMSVDLITNKCRGLWISHGESDFFDSRWVEQCQLAEDDCMGITLSVMLVNTLRYALNEIIGHRCLPNSEQKEEGPGCEFEHSALHSLALMSVGWFFVILLFATKCCSVESEEDDKEVEDSPRRVASSRLISRRSLQSIHVENDFHHIKERLFDATLTTFSMAYAWCIFHSAHQLAAVILTCPALPQWLGKERYATTLSVVLAFAVSYFSWFAIRILAFCTDSILQQSLVACLDCQKEVESGIKTVIRGTSLVVGFAWEQAFEASIDNLAERTRPQGQHWPAVMKLGICLACVGVVFLSWRWYILPYVCKKGWRFDNVTSRHELKTLCRELAESDPHFSVRHLQDIANELVKEVRLISHPTRFLLSHGFTQRRFDHVDSPEDTCKLPEHAYEPPPLQPSPDEVTALREHVRKVEEQLAALQEAEQNKRFLEMQLVELMQPLKAVSSSFSIHLPHCQTNGSVDVTRQINDLENYNGQPEVSASSSSESSQPALVEHKSGLKHVLPKHVEDAAPRIQHHVSFEKPKNEVWIAPGTRQIHQGFDKPKDEVWMAPGTRQIHQGCCDLLTRLSNLPAPSTPRD